MKIDEIILDVLGRLLTEEETLMIKELIKVIKAQEKEGKPANILSSNGFSGFQIYPCTQSPSGNTTKAG